MKKKPRDLSLNRFKIARITENLFLIRGGMKNEDTITTSNGPPPNSSLRCIIKATDKC